MKRMLEATRRAEDTHFWFVGLRRNARRLMEDALAGRRPGHIVDCGSGTGRNLEWLSALGEAVGIELTPFGLAAGHARGRLVVGGSVAALPFADASADAATSFDVLYCLDDATEARALSEMWRVLRPGGVALVNVAAFDILRGSHAALTHEVRRYTPSRLRARLSTAGFRVERLTFTNMTLFPGALASRSYQRLRRGATEVSDGDLRIPPVVNSLLHLASRMESGLLRVTNLPIGTSIMAVARKPG